ncbi:hypothetical protein B484DRAFT_420713 [Ochromonadaceae sp. CCMP2298]|nr:hypothetical protein B484DRAFT_420713 [Ochromonadaceae sp. CCMP2298]
METAEEMALEAGALVDEFFAGPDPPAVPPSRTDKYIGYFKVFVKVPAEDILLPQHLTDFHISAFVYMLLSFSKSGSGVRRYQMNDARAAFRILLLRACMPDLGNYENLYPLTTAALQAWRCELCLARA